MEPCLRLGWKERERVRVRERDGLRRRRDDIRWSEVTEHSASMLIQAPRTDDTATCYVTQCNIHRSGKQARQSLHTVCRPVPTLQRPRSIHSVTPTLKATKQTPLPSQCHNDGRLSFEVFAVVNRLDLFELKLVIKQRIHG